MSKWSYSGVIRSKADIETLKWLLMERVKKGEKFSVKVEEVKNDKSGHYLGGLYWE